MIELTDKELDKWKNTFAKDGIVYDSNDEYRQAVNNLVGFFDVLIEMDQQQKNTTTSVDTTPKEHPQT